jgi:hypothetical protein
VQRRTGQKDWYGPLLRQPAQDLVHHLRFPFAMSLLLVRQDRRIVLRIRGENWPLPFVTLEFPPKLRVAEVLHCHPQGKDLEREPFPLQDLSLSGLCLPPLGILPDPRLDGLLLLKTQLAPHIGHAQQVDGQDGQQGGQQVERQPSGHGGSGDRKKRGLEPQFQRHHPERHQEEEGQGVAPRFWPSDRLRNADGDWLTGFHGYPDD